MEDKRLIDVIRKKVKLKTTHKRYRHIEGVVTSAIWLANRYGADVYLAEIAALLHDYAKNYTKSELMHLADKFNLKLDPILTNAYQLLHGKIAAKMAQEEFGITNQDVLAAIEFHTTGRPDMSKLEQIIYLADFIEPGREYADVDTLRKLSEDSLERAVFTALNNTMIYVLKTNKLLHPNTLDCRNKMLINNPSLADIS
ncbi:bis(5'-nucleosyl)-tetraphosphatase (symmetrical) YqeK [Tindallia californiensis]|uniref:bis(5'-nucleosyl)-tetraphosphatase (symmetrical) n=1 Tax=Tindallia californiensis TaxID=159292 RepID=A0A1H3NCR9_9FIRM|nr:bis(5'-nucleosyl)-tetraphosphatase (symmetrical) YqeK [Tindallia californiensis]SDY86672.1 putative HD superfamily hydrolase of NAD metabolism [Tindallia californiensis]